MRLRYPKSFFQLISLGFALVALPLLFALLNNALSVDRLAEQSRDAVYGAVQATQASRLLVELLGAMERTVRQFEQTRDPLLLDGYRSTRQRFREVVGEFSHLPLAAEQRRELDDIARREAQSFAVITGPASAEQLNDAVDTFLILSVLGQSIVARSNARIDREVDELQALADRAQRIVLWQLLATVPVAAFLAVGFTLLINRPIRQIDRMMRRLGGGDFITPVAVDGPQDLERLGARLDWMRQRLLELEEQKSRFLRHVSHELKTPLTALREGAELLVDGAVGELSPPQREVAEILRGNGMALQRLIENLLSYSALQAHRVEAIQAGRVRLADIVARVAADQALALRTKALRLDADAGDCAVWGDADKIRVILDNLLSNAVKFSPPGATIRIRARRDGSSVLVDVIDAGPGIPAAERERVFEAFYRGSVQAGSRIPGTGLGLAISRELAQAHGGRLDVLDSPRGAHLRITLPASD